MQEHDELNPADHEVVEALRSLVPAAAEIDPVVAAFAAGRQSAQNQLVRWRALAAALLVAGSAPWLWPTGELGSGANHAQPVVVSHIADGGLTDRHAQSLVALHHSIYRNGIQSMPATNIPAAVSIRVSDRL
jgi:hypothetical protein